MYAQQLEWRCIKCGTTDEHLPGCPVMITNAREEKVIGFVVAVITIGLAIGIGSIIIWIVIHGS